MNFTGLHRCLRTTSDARGHYRLDGIAAGGLTIAVVSPPAGRAYFPISELFDVGHGEGPVPPLDLSLRRGVWIPGRVTECASGKADGRGRVPRLRRQSPLGAEPRHEMSGTRTESDGSFRLLGLPGRGFVAAEGPDGRHVRSWAPRPLRGPDAATKSFTPPILSSQTRTRSSAVVGIDPAEDAETISCELKPSTGSTRKGMVLGPDGRQLTGSWRSASSRVGTRTRHRRAPSFAVTALAPFEQRRLVFRHDDRKLIGTLVVPGDGSGALAVTLGPWASVTGRVVAEDGEAPIGYRDRPPPRPISRARPGRYSPAVLSVSSSGRMVASGSTRWPRSEVRFARPFRQDWGHRLRREGAVGRAGRGEGPGRPQGRRYDSVSGRADARLESARVCCAAS